VSDIITPNQFELGFLTGRDASDLASTLDAVDAARDMGPSTVLVTSLERPEREEGTIEMLAVNDSGAWLVKTPYLPFKRNGSGDVTAALFTGHYVSTGDAADALARTASSVFDLVENTYQADSRELLLVESQDAYANPRMQFAVEQVR
jgi:pyridoxine kinase